MSRLTAAVEVAAHIIQATDGGIHDAVESGNYLNDAITRARVTYAVSDAIRLPICRGEIFLGSWRVVCDETNNPPSLIEGNDLAVEIFAELYCQGYLHLRWTARRGWCMVDGYNFWEREGST